jgi:hypothetical protein
MDQFGTREVCLAVLHKILQSLLPILQREVFIRCVDGYGDALSDFVINHDLLAFRQLSGIDPHRTFQGLDTLLHVFQSTSNFFIHLSKIAPLCT